jgi:hypothetical protein
MCVQGHSHEQIVKEHEKEQVFKQVQICSHECKHDPIHIEK